jgi:antitoxin component of MazEF toxin-antitoxin module
MTRKQIGRNTGNSGRVNVSGSELEKLGIEIGDEVDVDVADAKEIAHAIIDSKDSDEFLIVTPA